MDQDSFRRLLQTPRPGGSSALGTSGSRGSFIAAPLKKKTVDASQPAFKPRKVKKSQESKYRDRASERRVGDGNDYAHIEAVLEDFEKRNADVEDKEKVEAQRKYLGGDSEHSILVKGLDFALLEQNKARSALTTDDLDALDQAYLESSSQHESAAAKKRTRQDLIRELKEQRAGNSEQPTPTPKSAEEEASLLEKAKQKGKFKPIGFKPIGQSSDAKKKSKSDTTDGEKKKKKRKANGEDIINKTNPTSSTSMAPPPIAKPVPTQPEEPVDNDFDIFAGAGEYEGIDVGDEDEEDVDAQAKRSDKVELVEGEESSSSSVPKRWIESDEPLPVTKQNVSLPSMQPKDTTSSTSPTHKRVVSDDEGAEESRPMRLAPLASSALPSIKEFLAMDKAAGSYDKKRKRKDKKKGGGGDDEDDDSKKKNVEAKVERDYKRLKSFTDKKAAGSK